MGVVWLRGTRSTVLLFGWPPVTFLAALAAARLCSSDVGNACMPAAPVPTLDEQKELQPIYFGIKLPPALIPVCPGPDIPENVLSGPLINKMLLRLPRAGYEQRSTRPRLPTFDIGILGSFSGETRCDAVLRLSARSECRFYRLMVIIIGCKARGQ